MKIYIAATFDRRQSLRLIREELTSLGHHITSSWLDEQDESLLDYETRARHMAIKDLVEVAEADCIILETGDSRSSGGKNTEWGFALARPGTRRWIVGPLQSIFHRLCDKQFASWMEVIECLTPGTSTSSS